MGVEHVVHDGWARRSAGSADRATQSGGRQHMRHFQDCGALVAGGRHGVCVTALFDGTRIMKIDGRWAA